jgi:excinuclease UvrABC helicase subunit UvrB
LLPSAIRGSPAPGDLTKTFFPENAVEYFVSYYDYYQPEAYIPSTDLYIEKETDINEEIDKLRHAATMSLFTRQDVVIVASVSCIYSLGAPDEYRALVLTIEKDRRYKRDELLRHLVDMQYERNDYDFARGKFRIRGDTLEIQNPDGSWVTDLEGRTLLTYAFATELLRAFRLKPIQCKIDLVLLSRLSRASG